MFDFIKNRFGKKSHRSQRREGLGSKLSKRDLFLEPLEDRRLLAADFSLSVSDGDVTEVGANPGEFTVLGTGTTAAPTVINLTIAGTATAGGTDYSTISSTVTIPAGTNTSQTIDVQGIIDDSLFEGDETVIVTLDSIASGDVGNTIDQASKTQSVDIVDDELAVVSVAVQDGAASETGPDDGAFRISLDKANNTGDTITVNYTMTGVATNGTDYATVDGTAEIADGNTFVDVLIDVLPDSIVEETESVTITLNTLTLPSHVDASKISIDTSNDEVSLDITDNDSALVSIAATDPAAAETGTNAGEFTITLSNQSSTATTVNYTVSGTSTDGTDFPSIGSSIVIPANTLSVTLAVDDIVDDSIVEANETVIVTLASVSGDPDIGVDGGANAATVTITDNDSALVSIAANDSSADENGLDAGQFTITQTLESSTDTTVTYLVTGSATPGADYTALTGTAVIPAGNTSVTVDVSVLQDTILEANETVIVTLTNVNGDPDITLDTDTADLTATVTIDSDDLATIVVSDIFDQEADLNASSPVVTYTLQAVGSTTAMDQAFTADINVTDGTAQEAGTGVGADDYDATDTNLSVITIGDTGSVTITINDDSVVERDETINVNLSNLSIGGSSFNGSNPYFSELTIDSDAVITIDNDDAAVISLSADGSADEPDSGTDNQTYTASTTASIEGGAALGTITVSLSGTAQEAGAGLGSNDYDENSTETILTTTWDVLDTPTIVDVDIVGDQVVELDETIVMAIDALPAGLTGFLLSDGSAAVTVGSGATHTITNEDSASIVISDVSLAEAALAGAAPTDLTFELVGDIDTAFTAVITVNDGNAREAGSGIGADDYDVTVEAVSLQASGDDADAKITVNDEDTVESHETLTADLGSFSIGGAVYDNSNPYWQSITIDDSGQLTILNDDSATFTIQDSVPDASLVEGGSWQTQLVVSQDIELPGGTAAATTSHAGSGFFAAVEANTGAVGSDDYDFTVQPVSLANGISAGIYNAGSTVTNQDAVVERDETLAISLDVLPAEVTGLVLADGVTAATTVTVATIEYTIENDDSGAFTVSASTDGAEDTGAFTVTLELDAQVELYGQGDMLVAWDNTTNGSKTADHLAGAYMGASDYAAGGTDLAFDGVALNQTQVATTTVNADSIVELDETFNVVFTESDLRGYGAAGTGDLSITADVTQLTIDNDEIATVTHSNSSGTVAEGSATTFVITLSNDVQTATYLDGAADNTPQIVTNYSSGIGVVSDLLAGQQLADVDDGAEAFVGDNDFEDVSDSWSYTGGDGLSHTYTVGHNQDVVVELEEVYRTNYSENDYLTYGAGSLNRVQLDLVPTLGTIAQEDSATFDIVLSAGQSSITEGTDDDPTTRQSTGPYAIVLDGDVQDYAGNGFDIRFSTSDGTAVEGSATGNGDDDYDAVNAVVSFDGNDGLGAPAGETENSPVVDVRMDEVVELDETFSINLAEEDFGPYGASGTGQITIPAPSETLTIVNDDAAALQVLDVAVSEDAGTVDVQIALDYPVDVPLSLRYNATNGLALHSTSTSSPAAANQEWEWVGGWKDYESLTLDANTDAGVEASADPGNGSYAEVEIVTFTILDDSVVELNEDFYVNIFNLTQGGTGGRDVSIADDDGRVTVVNDDIATVAVSSVTVNENANTATLDVTLSAPVDASVTVDVATSDGSATVAGGDYVANNETQTFAAFDTTTQTFTVSLDAADGTEDSLVELDEVINAVISNLQANGREVSMGTSDGSITITDNDTAALSVVLTGGATTVNEADGTITFDVSLTNPVAVPVTVSFGAQNPEQPGSYDDFAGGVGSITFAAGDNTTQSFTIGINDDAIVELDEELQVVLFGLDAGAIQDADNSDVSIASASDTFTVIDNDSASLSINDITVTENHHGHTFANLTVTLDTAVDVPVTIDVDTADSTATSATTGNSGDQDYVALDSTATFAGTAGETQTVTVQINGDNVVEATEQLLVDLSNIVANGREADISFSDAQGAITIENDDSATVSIVESSTGDEDSGNRTLAVTLSNPVDLDVSVDVDTADGTATTAGGDYDALDTALTFSNATGATLSQTVEVVVNSDSTVELDEALTAVLSSLSAGGRDVTLGNTTTDITLSNDESATISVNDVTVDESAGTATLTVTLSHDVDVDVAIDADTADSTATASAQGTLASDYDSVDETKTFTAGSGANATQSVVVTINDDSIVETNELLNVVLSGLAASGRAVTVSDDSGAVTVNNNDSSSLSVALTTDPGTLTEDSGSVTFTVSMSNPVAVPVTSLFGAVNPLMPGSYDDFAGGAGSVTWDKYESADQTFTLEVADDAVVELDETFNVQLFGLDAGTIAEFDNDLVTIGGQTASFTVIDNDSAGVSVSDVSVTEGDDGHSLATFTLTLDTAVDTPVDVQVDTADGTAISVDDGNNGNTDFQAVVAGNVRFAGTAGETQSVSVRINGDQVVELDESFSLVLSNIAASGREADISLTDGTGVATIENDDAATVTIEASETVVEAGGAAELTVTLSHPVDVVVSVDADDVEGTAKVSGIDASESDYTDLDESLTFSNASGSALQFTVSVNVSDDGIVELDEAMQVVLSSLVANGRSVALGNATADVNILNDDSAFVTINDIVVNEEDGSAELTVSLSAPVDAAVELDWETLDGSALAASNDYISASGTVAFAALSIDSQSVSVIISDDDIVELTENLHVGISEASASGRDVSVFDSILETGGDTSIVGSGEITIVNTDSATIEIKADQDYFTESDDGIVNATLTVTLSNPVDIPVQVSYSTANGDYNSSTGAPLAASNGPEYLGINSTADNEDPSDPAGYYDFVNAAVADSHDYDDTEGVLNFSAVNDGGVSGESTKTITIPVYGDSIVELDEWFVVSIDSTDPLGRDLTITKSEDYVWIDNDDSASLSINDATITEGDVGQAYAVLQVTLDNAVDVPLGLSYQTVDVGSATDQTTLFNGDNDYENTTGVLNFAGGAGEVVEIKVPVNGDKVVELDEVFEIHLSDIAAGRRDVTFSDAEAEVTILNDDSATVKIVDGAAEEGDSGTLTISSMVVLSNPVDVAVSTPFTTQDGSAIAGEDYTANAGTVSFGNLKTDARTFNVDISVLGDVEFERHEDLTVELGVLDAGGRDVTYLDTDDTPTVEARIDIVNDDRNDRNFVGVCNIIAEPGDVDLSGGLRYAAWQFSVESDGVPLDIQFTAATAVGENLEIGVPQVVNADGDVVSPLKVNHVTSTDATSSYGVFQLDEGDYLVVVPSANDTDGLIELAVSMPGVLSATDRTVTLEAFQQTAAGVLQTQLGYRGVMPEIFNDLMGIDLAVDQYDACLDSDLNGFLTGFDLRSVDNNVGSSVPGVSLIEDRFTAAQILDVNPLGQAELSVAELFGFSLYQNPENALDVNGDGHISPIDALVTINSLNDEGSRSVLVLGDDDGELGEFLNSDKYLYDTNGDFAITPIDVLQVVNALNAESASEGEQAEGERVVDDFYARFSSATVSKDLGDAVLKSVAAEVADTQQYGQEYYTTPVQQNWTESVDSAMEELQSDDDSGEDEELSIDVLLGN